MAERAGVSAPINLRGKLRTSAVAGVLGGLVFGYAAGVIAAAGLQLTAQFNLSAVQMSLVASALLVGGLVGAMLVGRLEQRYSTRSLLAVAASVAAVGALLSAVVSTDSIGPLIATRVVIGFGIGIISVSAPRYLSEISPSAVRGSRVATFQLMICVGFPHVVLQWPVVRWTWWLAPYVRRHRHSVCCVGRPASSLDTDADRSLPIRDATTSSPNSWPRWNPTAIRVSLPTNSSRLWTHRSFRGGRFCLPGADGSSSSVVVFAVGQILTGINAIM